jgi:hypothetical protein
MDIRTPEQGVQRRATAQHGRRRAVLLFRDRLKVGDMKKQPLCAAVVLAVVLGGGAAAAHHSRPGLDPTDAPIVMKAVVAEYRWRNPHVLLFWDVKDENGKVVRWVGEFASIASTIARGMDKNTFKVGEPIIVTGIPSRAGTPVALIRKIERPDGTEVAGNPD